MYIIIIMSIPEQGRGHARSDGSHFQASLHSNHGELASTPTPQGIVYT